MCSASLGLRVLPSSQKTAVITPVMKKVGPDQNEQQTYRLISNLMFMLQIIKQIMGNQIREALAECNLKMPPQWLTSFIMDRTQPIASAAAWLTLQIGCWSVEFCGFYIMPQLLLLLLYVLHSNSKLIQVIN